MDETQLVIPPLVTSEAKALGTKVLDANEGIVQALVGVSGNRDSDRDVIVPTAFVWGLGLVKPKGVNAHDWKRPTARTLAAVEVMPGDKSLPGDLLEAGFGALDVTMQYNLATQLGRETFETVKFYEDEQQWSIGYEIPVKGAVISAKPPTQVAAELRRLGVDSKVINEARWLKSIDPDEGPTRFIMRLKVWEYSDVLFGANQLTRTTSAKALDDMEAELQGMLDQVKSARERLVVTTSAVDAADLEPGKTGEVDGAAGAAADEGSIEKVALADVELKALEEAVAYAHAALVDPATPLDNESSTKALHRVEGVTQQLTKLLDEASIANVDAATKEALSGSWEERRDAIGSAVRAAFADVEDVWAYIVATFDDHVIVSVSDERGGQYRRAHFSVPYSIDEQLDVELGEATPVELQTVVVAATGEPELAQTKGLPPELLMAWEHERSQLG